MSTWRDAPDASGMWWCRHDGRDVVLQVDYDAEGAWVNRGGREGWCRIEEYAGARWCRVATPERVDALETEVGTLRAELDSVRCAAVLRGAP